MTKNIIIILTLFFIATGCANKQAKQVQHKLSATKFSEQINNTENAVIVDVRTPEEFKKGHLKNAVNINWKSNDFDKHIAVLNKSNPIFVYCLSGGRSGKAMDKMQELGFKNIIEMEGGIMQWRANNLPEITINPTANGMTVEQYQALLHSDKLVLVDFYADWCAPCKKMKPYLEKMAIEMANKVTLVRIDADKHIELCKTLNIDALPVLKLYKNRSLVWENKGYIEEGEVKEQFKEHIR
ncbi:MAG: thioredoxin domain-containing protein [Aestuariibaculum sp.]